MSQKDIKQELATAATGPQKNESLSRKEPPVFYRCTCPECGEDNLELYSNNVFLCTDFLGVTQEGEFGCGPLEFDGDFDWVIECRSCEYRAFFACPLPAETLLEWAADSAQATNYLKFTCPVCGTHHLDEVREMSREVRAVYEPSEFEGTEPRAEIARSYTPILERGKSVRYCCLEGHELTKEDGNLVETPEELVEWLKTHHLTEEG